MRRWPGAGTSRTGCRPGISCSRADSQPRRSYSIASTPASATTRSPRSPTSGGPHRSGAARRRARYPHGSDVAVAAPSLLPRTGRVPDGGFHRRRREGGLSRAGVARDLQRTVPRRSAQRDRARRHALAAGVRRDAEAERGRTGARPQRPSATLPEAADSGLEYIEFVTRRPIRRRLVALLEGLGFRVARHRSKEVDLWRQNASTSWSTGSRRVFPLLLTHARRLGLRARAALRRSPARA